MLNDWLQAQLKNNFQAFEGLSISGQVPLKDQVLNELLQDAMRSAAEAAPYPAAEAGQPSSSKPDVRPLLKFVKKAEIKAVNGAVIVDFHVAI